MCASLVRRASDDAVRVAAALAFGLYGSSLPLSLVAVAPALVGIAVGRRLRPHVTEPVQTAGTLGLLAAIAARLLAGGAAGP